jgi:Na+-translocating ferredoxin:NAD+ oxidoreductase RnfA subunit
MLALGTEAQPINKSIKITQHNSLPTAHYLQAVAVQFVQFVIKKQSIKAYCLLFVYFYTAPNSLG